MMQRLRVAMIIQSYLPRLGGAERQLAALAPLLQSLDVELHIFTRRYPGLSAGEVIDGVPVTRTPVWPSKALTSTAYTLLTLAHLRRFRPDVIHAHELLSPATTAVLAHQLWRTPVVAKVLRGGYLGDIDKLRRRLGGQRRLALLRRNVAAFITISREIERELEEIGITYPQQVPIPNGVDTDHFRPATAEARQRARTRLGLLTHAPIVLYTGRLEPEKRIDLLLAVWPAVRTVHPQATLLIVGSGPEQARLQVAAGEGIHWSGAVTDVRPYLQAADLFVLPSSTEGLSNALLEAMAAGLPPLATAVGGALDLIRPGENGCLIPPDNGQALEEALLGLLSNPARLAAVGQQARCGVVADYALPNVARRLRQLYDQVHTVDQRLRRAEVKEDA
jgi:glycosyltransferase involved in cell wall biosynthesis